MDWYIGLPEVALACKPGTIAAVMINRGWPVVGVGETVKVTVLVACTELFALLVAVRW
jgi:hypothetical protein